MDLEEKAERQRAAIDMKKERQKNKRRKNKKPVNFCYNPLKNRATGITSRKMMKARMTITSRNNPPQRFYRIKKKSSICNTYAFLHTGYENLSPQQNLPGAAFSWILVYG
jgi:DNA invertase Pin-like site-specific DNA recombinase